MDATRETPGWNDAGFDDHGWEKATVYQPHRVLSPDVIEPNRKCDRIPAKEVRPVSPGRYRFTMSKLVAGWVEVRLKGKPLRAKDACGTCGTKVDPGTKFCPECGTKIE